MNKYYSGSGFVRNSKSNRFVVQKHALFDLFDLLHFVITNRRIKIVEQNMNLQFVDFVQIKFFFSRAICLTKEIFSFPWSFQWNNISKEKYMIIFCKIILKYLFFNRKNPFREYKLFHESIIVYFAQNWIPYDTNTII